MLKRATLATMLLLTLAGCSRPSSYKLPTPVPSATNNILPAATPLSTATASVAPTLPPTEVVAPALPTITAASLASPTPYTTFTANPAVENLKLRLNPGMSFDALLLLQPEENLTVLGTAPGNEWTYVSTDAGVEGWVYTELLKSDKDLTQIPIREPQGLVIIQGNVVDASGVGIKGVGFAINQADTPQENASVAVTDANGNFYAYLPNDATGTWSVNYTAISCNSTVWQDASCSAYKAGYSGTVDPVEQTVNLPQNGDPLLFIWR